MAGRDDDGASRDLGSLQISVAGALVETEDLWEPYWLSGPDGGRVEAVSEYLRDLQAAGRPATTQRSYALALLRWFRFTWAVGVPWDQATRTEARDFCRYLQLADKPGRTRAVPAPVPGRWPASVKFAPPRPGALTGSASPSTTPPSPSEPARHCGDASAYQGKAQRNSAIQGYLSWGIIFRH